MLKALINGRYEAKSLFKPNFRVSLISDILVSTNAAPVYLLESHRFSAYEDAIYCRQRYIYTSIHTDTSICKHVHLLFRNSTNCVVEAEFIVFIGTTSQDSTVDRYKESGFWSSMDTANDLLATHWHLRQRV